jgi:hypothetical protein
MKNRVYFKIFKNEIIALFPHYLYNEKLYGNTIITCYVHYGQHGSAARSLIHCKNAPGAEYAALKNELINRGYNIQKRGKYEYEIMPIA